MYLKKGIILLVILLNIASMAAVIFHFKSEKRMGYIDLAKVFESFEYKKILEKDLESYTLQRQAALDSLVFDLKILKRRLQSGCSKKKSFEDSLHILDEKYQYFEKQFSEERSRLTELYDEKILKQINQYVKDYGIGKGYDYIFGADGTGGLMYAEESEDITDEIIAYINSRFKGEKE